MKGVGDGGGGLGRGGCLEEKRRASHSVQGKERRSGGNEESMTMTI